MSRLPIVQSLQQIKSRDNRASLLSRIWAALGSSLFVQRVPVTVTARVPAELGASQATWQVTVVNPPSTADELFPKSIAAGSQGLTIRVFDAESGLSFVAGSTIYWNGSPRTTREGSSACAYFCDYSRWLEADIDAADLASPGYATVTVVNPPPGGGTSGALTFTIGPGAARAPLVRAKRPPRQPRLGGPRN